MPPLARRYLRTALGFTVLGVLTGIHMSFAEHLGAGVMHRWYVPAHTHVILVGGLALAVCGLGHWKLPEPARREDRDLRGIDDRLYWLLAAATLARFVAESALGYFDPEPSWLHRLANHAGTLQGVVLVLVLLRFWPRLR